MRVQDAIITRLSTGNEQRMAVHDVLPNAEPRLVLCAFDPPFRRAGSLSLSLKSSFLIPLFL